jgi:hypothetical protein
MLQVAAYAEGLTIPGMGALKWLLSGVSVAMDSKTARSAECLVASRVDILILALRECGSTSWVKIVMVLLGVCFRWSRSRYAY